MLAATNIALKEWASVAAALTRGQQIFLLRKGGIAEEDGDFRIRHREFFLYPTYEHQHQNLLQPEYRSSFREALESSTPTTDLPVTCYTVVEDFLVATSEERLLQMENHYIWSQSYIKMRFKYKPELPLYVMFLRAYQLPQPWKIPILPRYAGCKSWVELDRDLSTAGATPVFPEADFLRRKEALKTFLTAGE